MLAYLAECNGKHHASENPTHADVQRDVQALCAKFYPLQQQLYDVRLFALEKLVLGRSNRKTLKKTLIGEWRIDPFDTCAAIEAGRGTECGGSRSKKWRKDHHLKSCLVGSTSVSRINRWRRSASAECQEYRVADPTLKRKIPS